MKKHPKILLLLSMPSFSKSPQAGQNRHADVFRVSVVTFEDNIISGHLLSLEKLQDGVVENYSKRILHTAGERYMELALPVLTDI